MGQLVQRPAWPWGALNERKDLGAQAGFWGEGWPPLLGEEPAVRDGEADGRLLRGAAPTPAQLGNTASGPPSPSPQLAGASDSLLSALLPLWALSALHSVPSTTSKD